MKSLVVPAVCSALVTGLSTIGIFASMGFDSPARRLASVVAWPAVPGQLIVAILGIGGGPGGFPTQANVAPYVINFLLWLWLFHLARGFWRRRAARR